MGLCHWTVSRIIARPSTAAETMSGTENGRRCTLQWIMVVSITRKTGWIWDIWSRVRVCAEFWLVGWPSSNEWRCLFSVKILRLPHRLIFDTPSRLLDFLLSRRVTHGRKKRLAQNPRHQASRNVSYRGHAFEEAMFRLSLFLLVIMVCVWYQSTRKLSLAYLLHNVIFSSIGSTIPSAKNTSNIMPSSYITTMSL